MVRRRGPRLTLAEKTELWRRWRRGESLNAIGRALGRIAHVVRYEVARTGGLPPPVRRRSPLALTLREREAPGSLDGESGGAAARGTAPLSSRGGRCGDMGARPAAQAVSLGDAPPAA